MFEPTIKYKRVNEKSKEDNVKETETEPKATSTIQPEAVVEPKETNVYDFEEEQEDSTIKVDPNDKDRIIVTLSTGKKFSADRYCPHAGADLSYHGRVGEHDYPTEIGPILMCSIHYWEFALERGGKGGSGFTTINACPIDAEKCSLEKKKLDW